MIGYNKYAGKFLGLSLVFVVMAMNSVAHLLSMSSNLISEIPQTIGLVFIGLSCSILGGALFHLALLPISSLHNMLTATIHYFLNVAVYFIGYRAWRKSEWHSKNVRTSQQALLIRELSQNANTEFGKTFHFSEIHNYEDFRSRVPLTTYDDYRRYIERIEKGEQNMTIKDKVIRLNLSSGTIGKSKLLPYTERAGREFLSSLIFPLIFRQRAKNKAASPFAPLKTLDFLFSPQWRYAECGLPIGPLSGNPGKESLMVSINRTTPSECLKFMSEPAQMYLHWLYALYDECVFGINGSFAGTELVGFQFLQDHWEQILNDIRNGTLTNTLGIPYEVAAHVQLPPNPERANELQRQFSKGFEGIIKRVWPLFGSNWCISSGAHAVYTDRLRWYLGKRVDTISPLYSSSEAVFGFPMSAEQDKSFTYGLLAGITFMEFIPDSEIASPHPNTLLMHQLELGKCYEIVPTSLLGFYRYRVGDVVKVVDFHHETPVVEFCTRVGGILDLRGEKTTEDMIFKAISASVSAWSDGTFCLHDFTATDSETLAKASSQYAENYLHYALFVEVSGLCRALSQAEVSTFDNFLMEINYPYKSFRLKNGIGFPKIFVVEQGSFEALKRLILDRNIAVSNQFKTQRYQSNVEFIRFLLGKCYQL